VKNISIIHKDLRDIENKIDFLKGYVKNLNKLKPAIEKLIKIRRKLPF